MLSLLLVVSTVVAALATAKSATTVVVTSVPAGLYKKNRELKRNMRLGVNSEFREHKTKKMVEALKAGEPTMPPEQETFELFQFEEEQLPKSMHWLTKIQFFLTEKELFQLFAMVRRQMMDEGQGPFFKTTMALCEEHGISYQKMANHARLLSGRIDYEELIWLSGNRLADPFIRQKLLKNG